MRESVVALGMVERDPADRPLYLGNEFFGSKFEMRHGRASHIGSWGPSGTAGRSQRGAVSDNAATGRR